MPFETIMKIDDFIFNKILSMSTKENDIWEENQKELEDEADKVDTDKVDEEYRRLKEYKRLNPNSSWY